MPDNFILPKRDAAATKALRANQFFLDGQSYITLPDDRGICHFIFKGKDIERARRQAMIAAGQKCEADTHDASCPRTLWGDAEMDHIRGGDSGRCSCIKHGRKPGNLRMLNRLCHVKKHNREPQWTRRPIQEGTVEA